MPGAYFRFIMRHASSQLTVKQTNSVQSWVKCFLAAKGVLEGLIREIERKDPSLEKSLENPPSGILRIPLSRANK